MPTKEDVYTPPNLRGHAPVDWSANAGVRKRRGPGGRWCNMRQAGAMTLKSGDDSSPAGSE